MFKVVLKALFKDILGGPILLFKALFKEKDRGRMRRAVFKVVLVVF